MLYLLDGGDLHRLSRILGHSTVITTERCYLRFKPAGFELDYGRVAFVMPGAAPASRSAPTSGRGDYGRVAFVMPGAGAN